MSGGPDFQQNTEKFVQWVNDHFKNVSSKFEVTDLREQGQGRGLIATENISKNELLFELSRDSILNVSTAAISKVRPENRAVLDSLNQWQALIICVSYELYLGDKSRFCDYFGVLPLKSADYNSLMFWSDKELQYLKPSGVLNRIGKDAAEEMYALLVADTIPNRLQCPELAEFLTLEKFHVVASLIMSYSFDVEHSAGTGTIDAKEKDKAEEEEEDDDDDDAEEEEEEEINQEDVDQALDKLDEPEAEEERVSEDSYFKSMVPLADTLNSNTSLVNAKLQYKRHKLVMVADKNIKKGEQIFNIYGELPNSEILRKYGYVEVPSSKFEFADILQSSIKEFLEKEFTKKISFLKETQSEKLLEVVLDTIQESEYLAETLDEEMEYGLVVDRYEVYAHGEVLTELVLLLLIISSILLSAESDEKWFKKLVKSVERKPSADLIAFINRTILKSYQLLQEKFSLTKSTVEFLKKLVKLRIADYPTHITDGTYNLPEKYGHFSRKELSDVVLFNEVKCLKDVIDGEFPPKNEKGKPKFSIIDDEKFLKNLLKRKLEEQDDKQSKKRRRH